LSDDGYRGDLQKCRIGIPQYWAGRGDFLKIFEQSVFRLRGILSPAPFACLLILAGLVPAIAAQTNSDSEQPIPILTGNAGFIASGAGQERYLTPQVTPVLLLPLGDKWLVEARAAFEGELEREEPGDPYRGQVGKDIDYLQVDYLLNKYATVTAGRFLTPFGIYNERLYPIWIRDLQNAPLIFPLGTGSSDGVMLRGGFPLNSRISLNYASYFSALSTVNKFEADRLAGMRAGFFLPGPRIEAGFSFQKELQESRTNGFGFHFAWQPLRLPLNLRSEYARTNDGSGYWIEGAYRLNQLPFWQNSMRKTEVVLRTQQFFAAPGIEEEEAEEYGLFDVDTKQTEFGLNYYLADGLKAAGSFGRRFNSDGDANVWTVGIAYRFAIPLGPTR